jgi:SAM-dependent methyltransferase
MDRQRYSRIAHGDMPVWNPVQLLSFDDFASRLTVPQGGRVLDIGCGRAHWLVKAAERFDVETAIGVDSSAYAASAARREATNSPARDRVQFIDREFDPAAFGDESFDLVFCVGSTHALSHFDAALRQVHRLLRPRAQLLVGEGYWKRTPDPAYLAFLHSQEDEYTTHEGNCRRATDLGYELQWHYECTDAEWSLYEDRFFENIKAYVRENSTDPDSDEMLSEVRAWHEHYLRFGRTTLGFGLYLLGNAGPLLPIGVAREFAACLDRREYEALREFVTDNCVYEFRGTQITGPDAIVAAYRDATEWAFEAFDQVKFASSVAPETDCTARITFIDRLTKNSHQHQHTCQQLVAVDETGRIARITHGDLPGEAESLDAFFATHNIHRPRPPQA